MNFRYLVPVLILLNFCFVIQSCNAPQSESKQAEEAKKETATMVDTEMEVETTVDQETMDVLFIREKYAQISNATNYRRDTFETECGGGPMKFERKYNEKNELAYLYTEFCSDHGCEGTHHYFWEGNLIFIFSQQSYWVGNTDELRESRTYLKNGQMFRCLEKKVNTTNGTPKIEDLLKKASNSEADCSTDRLTKDIEQLIALNIENAQTYFCE